MPTHREHRDLCRKILGSDFGNIHEIMDVGYVWLGPKHRRVGHDWWTPLALALWFKDWKAGAASFIHLAQDFSRREPIRETQPRTEPKGC